MKIFFLVSAVMILFAGCSGSSTPSAVEASSEHALVSKETASEASVASQAPILDVMDFIEENLPHDIYASYRGIEENIILIWCIDKEKVAEIMEQHENSAISIVYNSAKYPRSELEPIFNEIIDLPIMIENMGKLESISITGEGIEINSKTSENAIFFTEWLKSYQHQKYVHVAPQAENSDENWFVEPILPQGDTGSVAPPSLEKNAEAKLLDYLTKTLSPDDYAHIALKRHTDFVIYCINQENVKQVVEEYGPVPFSVIYETAKYSLSTLQVVLQDLEAKGYTDDFGVTQDGVFVSVHRNEPDIDQFYKWLEQYPYKDYIILHEYDALNPS